ncbi:exodeoxyribonuclease V subunit gamma [Caldimonas tepidiphila]|uniref:exodeoxyribonuclease V subunit gamma n=1 Tax=Caldimonas tepidiphila TaxID=2315841 RepID=UPI001F0BDD70|nr:exodeoxyribonuclease V subunit gamma [Caldimonas tepidiphila]
MSSPTLPHGLMFVHSNHPEQLRQLLVTWMRRYPLAPLEKETILVQSMGMAHWLQLALAEDAGDEGGGCGIAASLEMVLPSTFQWQVYRAVLGHDQVPEHSPFDKELLVWRLMRLLPRQLKDEPYEPLRRFLANDADQRKLFQLAERIADLFDQYQVYRAAWLHAWARGQDVLTDAHRGESRPLPQEQQWQAALWRALIDDVKAAAGDDVSLVRGRAAVHQEFMARKAGAGSERPEGLPRRLIVFGISALPQQSLEVLHELSRWCQVLVCVHNPCQHHWADIIAGKDLLGRGHGRQGRRKGMPADLADESLHLHAHPLLAAWGKQGRDFISLLDTYDSEPARKAYEPHFEAIRQRIDLFAPHGETCLLNQLQDDIRDLRPLRETRETWPAVQPDDASIRFHVAHSPQREVEVLHDQLLAAFSADATLAPKDVIVMVPDIEAYVPHIQAVFGLVGNDDKRFIPFRIADLGQRHQDPLVNAIVKLLGLPQSRIAMSDVLDLLEVPALRRRFGIGEDDLPRLRRWIHGANVRWGLHAAHRQSLGLPGALDGNTWLFGMRRMLLGYAVGDTGGAWQGIEPYDEIGGLDAALLGPLAKLLERLEASWRVLCEEADPAGWRERLGRLVDDFFDPEDSEDAYTLERLEATLASWEDGCKAAGLDAKLPLSVVAEHWLAGIEDVRGLQGFLVGAVTFATLLPMRAIPFRHVYLLGMNDGDYPRTRAPLDFDLMGHDYRPGDRSRREDDRYLFLEALLSARERLSISWVGRSIHDNAVRPPSVLVGQLRDHLAAGWRLAGRESDKTALLDALTVEHRLQPFNPDYFPAQPTAARLYTYAREWHGDARPASEAEGGTLGVLARAEPLRLADLAGFLRAPAKTFFQQRLKVHFDLDDPVAEDHEPFALDGLQMWSLWDELVAAQAEALSAGASPEEALKAGLGRIRGRGELPAGAFSEVTSEALAKPMEDMFKRYSEALARWPDVLSEAEDVRYHSAATGLSLEGRLPELRKGAEGQYARVILETSDLIKDRKYQRHSLIKHWITHLAGHLTGRSLTTVVVSKAGNVEFGPRDCDDVRHLIEDIIDAWQEGMTRPLPLAVKTAFAWLQDTQVKEPGKESKKGAQKKDSTPKNTAPKVYEGDGYEQPGEVESCPYLRRVWPDYAALSTGGEFQRLAQRLLLPLYKATSAKDEADAPAGDQA